MLFSAENFHKDNTFLLTVKAILLNQFKQDSRNLGYCDHLNRNVTQPRLLACDFYRYSFRPASDNKLYRTQMQGRL